MWSQKLVCGLFANNVASFAVIVGPTSRMFAANVGRRVPLFVGQPPDDCGLSLFTKNATEALKMRLER